MKIVLDELYLKHKAQHNSQLKYTILVIILVIILSKYYCTLNSITVKSCLQILSINIIPTVPILIIRGHLENII